MKHTARVLYRRIAETTEGNKTLDIARALARLPENETLSDAELIRLAYWGQSDLPFPN